MKPPEGPRKTQDVSPRISEGDIEKNPTVYLRVSLEALAKANLELSESQIKEITDSFDILREKVAPIILKIIGKKVSQLIKEEFKKEVILGKVGFNLTFQSQDKDNFFELEFPDKVPYSLKEEKEILAFLEVKFPGVNFEPGFRRGTATGEEGDRHWVIFLPDINFFRGTGF